MRGTASLRSTRPNWAPNYACCVTTKPPPASIRPSESACAAPSDPMNRIVVVGTTNAGKTTMARRLAAKLGVPHVELDALFWEPNWTEADDDVFVERVQNATAGDRWVACGNYSQAHAVLWPRLD